MLLKVYICKDFQAIFSKKIPVLNIVPCSFSTVAGLCYLHGLNPPFVHGNFKTGSVLVDEDFIAKVADAGLSKILEKIEDGASSVSSSLNAFKDPE